MAEHRRRVQLLGHESHVQIGPYRGRCPRHDVRRRRAVPQRSPSPDPSTTMSTDELVAKVRVNAEGVLKAHDADAVIDTVLGLEEVDDIAGTTRLLRSARQPEQALSASRPSAPPPSCTA